MFRSRSLALIAAALAALAAGCGSEPAPSLRTAARPTAAQRPITAPPADPRPSTSLSAGSVHIDDRIMRACGDLPTAHFAFDSTTVQPDAATTLDALARCLTTGPLRGKGLMLVGHADPRGETEYNLGLGHRRAGTVADYLAGRGLDRSHLHTTSKGEFEAKGGDEHGWARDRKVEIVLNDGR